MVEPASLLLIRDVVKFSVLFLAIIFVAIASESSGSILLSFEGVANFLELFEKYALSSLLSSLLISCVVLLYRTVMNYKTRPLKTKRDEKGFVCVIDINREV